MSWLCLTLTLELLFASDPLEWQAGEGFRRAGLEVPVGGKSGFTELPPSATGIGWTNALSEKRYTERQNLMNGAGVALGDFDGDGWCDIYLCNMEGPNGLYRNLGGWRFVDVASEAGVACEHQSSSGAVFADLNGDGRLDLLVTSFRGLNACFLNMGGGTFSNVTEAAGLVSSVGGTSQALGDIDGDGDLDLYVCAFGFEAILRDGGAYSMRMIRGKPTVTGRYAKRLAIIGERIVEFGEPDTLFLNDGSGRFTAVRWEAGFKDERGNPMEVPRDFGLAVQIRDINEDGFPDIYTCNDFQTPDRMWINDGTGKYRAVDPLALRNMSYASMGADFGDLDRDGDLDFFAVEMLSPDHARHMNQASPFTPLPRAVGAIQNREEVARNTICWNRGDGTFEETAFFSGVAASDWSWTPVFLDVDLDGYEDILVSNGHMHDVNDRDVTAARRAGALPPGGRKRVVLMYPPLITPNAAFHNRGDRTFAELGDTWGFNSTKITHGMAVADLDRDGDLDVVANCINSSPLVYRNDSSASRVAVRLRGRAPNIQGIGATIVFRGGAVIQKQEIISGGRYLSGDDTIRTFATGGATDGLSIEVKWRSGVRSVVRDVRSNSLYEIDERGAAENRDAETENANAIRPMFEDVSQLINHTHSEIPFDDFAVQPLLPKKLSQLGPGVAWFDLDDDGDDDLMIGSGKGGAISVFENQGRARFKRWEASPPGVRLTDDSTGILGLDSGDGKRSILIGLSNYETAPSGASSLWKLETADGGLREGAGVGKMPSSVGPIALADMDADGDLDLFAGGRLMPGRYPEAASSRVFRNTGNGFEIDANNSRVLERVGLVTGAVFTDLNLDGHPELALACEWGPIRVFRNNAGRLSEITSELGFARMTGLWTSIAAGDFDGDGRMDLVAGNWGRNSFYNQAPDGPWDLYYGDWNGDGRIHLLEAYPNRTLGKVVPWRNMDVLAVAFPWLQEQIKSHKEFGRSGTLEILKGRDSRTTRLQVTELRSTVFLNRNDGFEAVPLPDAAQLSPVFGIGAGDLNGDGLEDLFVSQNYFCVRPEDNRLDAGRGLWLKGKGNGRFTAVSGVESGITIYGEQRGCALSDFDRDGRTDLAVAQNGAATKLYRNTGAKPGLRIRLAGEGANPDGIGALVRLELEGGFGPVREVHAGGGYWSQDSSTIVMGLRGSPKRIQVRWPGGNVTTSEIPNQVREIKVDWRGVVTDANIP